MKNEFKNDKMMSELHKIRREQYEKTKHMSNSEFVELIHRESEGYLKSKGYTLIPGKMGYKISKGRESR